MTTQYDCIIAGAGLAGFAAATGAALSGAKVLLLDKLNSAGGSAVYALTPVLSGWGKNAPEYAVGKMLADELKAMDAYEWRVNRIVTDEDSLQAAMISILKKCVRVEKSVVMASLFVL